MLIAKYHREKVITSSKRKDRNDLIVNNKKYKGGIKV